jgi:hypothetical protein
MAKTCSTMLMATLMIMATLVIKIFRFLDFPYCNNDFPIFPAATTKIPCSVKKIPCSLAQGIWTARH